MIPQESLVVSCLGAGADVLAILVLVVLTPVADSGIFTVEGADHPGIVHSISSALAKHGLSIEKMQTDQEIAPYGGSMLFRMRGIASAAAPLAKSFDSAVIQKELKDLGDSLNCDVTLEDKIDDSASGVFYAG